MRNITPSRTDWKTLKIIEIGDEIFVVQQAYDLMVMYEWDNNGVTCSMVSQPVDNHRIVPLREIVDNNKELLAALDR